MEAANDYPSADEGAERLGIRAEEAIRVRAALTASRAAVEARGVKFAGPTHVIPGKVSLAEFADPDGHRLRFAGPPPR